jgi:hypothetical protein
MSQQFLVEMSDKEAEKYQRIAKFSGKPVETVIRWRLKFTPPPDSLDIQIEQVASYSDEALWEILETPVYSDEELAEREPILQRAKAGSASEEDKKRLEEFSILYNKRGLLRAKALAELLERGYDIHTYLKESMP